MRVVKPEFRGELGRQLIELHSAERAAQHLAALDQLIDDSPDEVARNRKSNALVAAAGLPVGALADDAGVDADELTAHVDERPAGISWINRGIGLNEIFVFRKPHVRAAERADDARRDGLVQLVRTPDGQHPLSHLQARRVAPREGRLRRLRHLHQRDIGGGIGTDNFAGQLVLVAEDHGDFRIPALDDVIVRHDVAIGGNQHAGAEAHLGPAARAEHIVLVAEEILKHRIVRPRRIRRAHDPDRRNVHHALDCLRRDAGEVGETRRRGRGGNGGGRFSSLTGGKIACRAKAAGQHEAGEKSADEERETD